MLNPYVKHLIATIAAIGTLLLANACHAEIKSTKIPRYDAAVAKAVSFLQRIEKVSESDSTLVAYALLKAGVPQSDPKIVAGLKRAKAIAAANNFGSYHPLYEASVAAMLLADANAKANKPDIQRIVDRIISFQRPNGSWSAESSSESPDVSLMQYCVLAIWAAQRSDCQVAAQVVDKVTNFFAASANADGGWRYRPGSNLGPEKGRSSHNMTLAAVGSLSIGRLFLYGVKDKADKPEPKKYGFLEKADNGTPENIGVFGDYEPQIALGNISTAIRRGVQWNETRFAPIPHTEFPLYFYYTLERAAALTTFRSDWFTVYGDALLTLQGKDGSFSGRHSEVSPSVATSFAVLYYMRSTQQILDKMYDPGLQAGGRLEDLRGKKEKKELGPLDELLGALENADFSELDKVEAVVEKIQFGSKEELIGQVDKLKLLAKSDNAANRRAAFFALGRTGDFDLIPEMIKGLRDKNLDVNVEALRALRYISRKPNGFGISENPLEGPELSSDEEKLIRANQWRTKAYRAWGKWYRGVRPYEESGGLDELELRALQPSR